MMPNFSSRLRELRLRSGRSQQDLSHAAGLSKNMVQQLEAGTLKSTSIDNAVKLARVLGVPITELIGGSAPGHNSGGFAEAAITPWTLPRHQGQRPDLIESTQRLIRTLAPKARTPATFRLAHNYFGFSLLSGDIVIIDQAAKPETGDLVVAQVVDYQTGAGSTVLRRYLPPYLIADQITPDTEILLADGQRTSVMGPVVAAFRANQLA